MIMSSKAVSINRYQQLSKKGEVLSGCLLQNYRPTIVSANKQTPIWIHGIEFCFDEQPLLGRKLECVPNLAEGGQEARQYLATHTKHCCRFSR